MRVKFKKEREVLGLPEGGYEVVVEEEALEVLEIRQVCHTRQL